MTTQPNLPHTEHALTHATVLAIDTETTGVDPTTARLLQLAAYAVQPDGTADPLLVTLVDPGAEVEIPAEASAVHGLTSEVLVYAPPAAEVLAEVHHLLYVTARLGVPTVAYNAPYDLGVLGAELDRHGYNLPAPLPPIIDPLVLDRHIDRYRKGSRKLADVAAHHGVTLPEGMSWHDASADCLAAAQLARVLLDGATWLHALTLTELHAVQVGAYQDWQAGFNAWRARKGQEPIAGGWPL